MNLLFLILLSFGLHAAPPVSLKDLNTDTSTQDIKQDPKATQAEAPTKKHWLKGNQDDLRNPKRVELGKGAEINKERENEFTGRKKP